MASIRWRRVVLVAIPLGAALGVILIVSTALLLPAPALPPSDAWRGDLSLAAAGTPETIDAAGVTVTDNLQQFDRTFRLGPTDNGGTFDELAWECHGGRAHVVWHVGNLEPINPDTGIHLTALMDGERIASILVGSTRGIWNDQPVDLRTVVDCPAGPHVLVIEVTSIHGGWGFPYVTSEAGPPSTRLVVNRGFIVTEYWRT